MLHLTFLGTSSGTPTLARNVSALAVQTAALPGKGWMLIDCGEGTQHQLLRTRLPLHRLECICITHAHGDHCYGLPGLLESMALQRRSRPLRLVAPCAVWQWWQATQGLTDAALPFPVLFTDIAALGTHPLALHTEGAAGPAAHPSTTTAPESQPESLSHDGTPPVQLHLGAHALQHRVPSHALRLDVRQRVRRLDVHALRATGLPPGPDWRALRNGQDVVHAGRTLRSRDFVQTHTRHLAAVMGGDNADPHVLHAACRGAQLLVHEATYAHATLQAVGPAPMHSSARQVGAFAAAAALPHLILTHFSPRHHSAREQAALRAEAQAAMLDALAAPVSRSAHPPDGPPSLHLARDFDQFILDFDGRLRHLPPDEAHTNSAS